MKNITVMAIALLALVFDLHIGNAQTNNDPLQPVIETTLGKVRGMRSFVTNQQTPVDKFLGIPYAQPPLADRRFRRPTPANPWTGIRDAVKYSFACYQIVLQTGFSGGDVWNPTMPVSEDCLYLNIWVPRISQGETVNLTTMVWIHGGGFAAGSADSDMYDGSVLAATQNVIVASMNYRLGPFGFLYFGTPAAPGNMGLMDQQLALKWIFENIENFGGDSQKISIFGESAGGVSVSFHLLSPKSWDYFSSAIMESGTASNPWAFQSPNGSMITSKSYAKAVQCSADNTDKIIECLNKKSTEELLNQATSYIQYEPTVDGEFINKSPEELIREKRFKRCNIMLGYNTDEQTIIMSFLADTKFGLSLPSEPTISRNEIKEYINRVSYSKIPPLPNNSLALDSALYVYVDSVPTQKRGSNYRILADIVGDYEYKCSVVQFAKVYAAENLGVYFYQFDHRSQSNPWPRWMGVIHGSEIPFVFGEPYNNSLGYSSADIKISDVMMSYWSTFASKGDPNNVPQSSNDSFWPSFTTTDEKYKVLKANLLETKQFPRFKECSFWKDFKPILERYTETKSVSEAAYKIHAGFLTTFSCLFFSILSTLLI